LRIGAAGFEVGGGNADAVSAEVSAGVDPVLGLQLESSEATKQKQLGES
jgi:hypothetical protein